MVNIKLNGSSDFYHLFTIAVYAENERNWPLQNLKSEIAVLSQSGIFTATKTVTLHENDELTRAEICGCIMPCHPYRKICGD